MAGVRRVRTTDGEVDEASGSLHWGFNTHRNLFGGVRIGATHEVVPEPFDLTSRVQVAAGPYTTGYVRASGGTPFDRRLRAQLTLETGGIFAGRRSAGTLEATWVPSRHVEVGGVTNVSRLDYGAQGRYVEHVSRGRVRLAFSSRWFAEAYGQGNTFRGAVTTNVRVRYNPSEGHDLWLALDQVRADAGAGTSVTVKYSRMFIWDIRRVR
jgi:hypothetical protein